MKKKPMMYFEHEKGIIHCEAADGVDYTLCGFTLDGDQGEITEAVGRTAKITCSDCLGIIAFCRTIPQSALRRAHQQSTTQEK